MAERDRRTNCVHREDGKRCRRRARYFGRWAGGGLCYDHAIPQRDQLHYADRERFNQEMARVIWNWYIAGLQWVRNRIPIRTINIRTYVGFCAGQLVWFTILLCDIWFEHPRYMTMLFLMWLILALHFAGMLRTREWRERHKKEESI